MSRKTSLSTAGQTYRTDLYNDLREEARASSYLLAFAQDDPDLTLKVSPGNPYFGTTLVEFAGGNSPEFTAPTTHPRIDILSINDSGTLVRTAGDEDDSPTAPAVPAGNIPIAQVFNRVDQTSIKDEDDSTNGYIEKDLRPFLWEKFAVVDEFDTPGSYSWSKLSGAKSIKVEIWGGGGSGAQIDDGSYHRATGGGGGGYREKFFGVDDIPSSVTVVVGSGGASVSSSTNGNSGEASSFDSFSVNGGSGGRQTTSGGTVSGASGGSVSSFGESGADAGNASSLTLEGESTFIAGAGGGSASSSGSSSSGGSSDYGGDGGDGKYLENGGAGQFPAGGGGGAIGTVSSGAGGDGKMRITTFF